MSEEPLYPEYSCTCTAATRGRSSCCRMSTCLITINHSLNNLLIITEPAIKRTLQPHRLHCSPCLLQEHGEGDAVSRQSVSVPSRDQGTAAEHPLNWRTGPLGPLGSSSSQHRRTPELVL